MLIRDQIKKQIQSYLNKKEYNIQNWIVEIPKDRTLADYASNISFLLAKLLHKSPVKIATEIATEIKPFFIKEDFSNLKIFALKGFINFELTNDFCYKYISQPQFTKDLIRDKILLEYVSANPTGPLHIGHGRWAAVGDSLKRILQHIGNEVYTEFYINDAGKQIENLLASVDALKQGKGIPEQGYAGNYVHDLINKTNPISYLVSQQKEILEEFKVNFDQWYSEKNELHDTGHIKTTIDILEKKGYLYKNNGALFFKSTSFGDDKDRVLIKENGDYTYFAADIAYHYLKAKRGFTKLINIWGSDHHGYIARIKAALQALTNDAVELEVLLGQLVTLLRDGKEVKMSKRTGELITLEEVIQEIGIDATRFFLVMKSTDTKLDFDLDLAKKESNDNPVYYVQYAHARISSIIKKSTYTPKFNSDIELTDKEKKLLKFIISFEDELYLAATRREPHRITTYLLTLANLFHTFYHECQVNTDNKSLSENRLALINFSRNILKTGLNLLGVSAPESM